MSAVAEQVVRPQVSPLHDWHLAQGAKMVTFAGWEMPVAYGSVKEEHAATRASAGLFDVSHMGRLLFVGDAVRAVEAVFSRKVSDLRGGRCRYGFVTNAAGGVRDDVIVGRETDGGVNMVCNAANREKLLGHFAEVLADRGIDCGIEDQTAETAMLAVQGPAVMGKVRELAPSDAGLDGLKRYGFARLDWLGCRRWWRGAGTRGRTAWRSRSPPRPRRWRRGRWPSTATGAGRAGWRRGTRCGSRPGCRSTATSSPRRSTRSRRRCRGRSI